MRRNQRAKGSTMRLRHLYLVIECYAEVRGMLYCFFSLGPIPFPLRTGHIIILLMITYWLTLQISAIISVDCCFFRSHSDTLKLKEVKTLIKWRISSGEFACMVRRTMLWVQRNVHTNPKLEGHQIGSRVNIDWKQWWIYNYKQTKEKGAVHVILLFFSVHVGHMVCRVFSFLFC